MAHYRHLARYQANQAYTLTFCGLSVVSDAAALTPRNGKTDPVWEPAYAVDWTPKEHRKTALCNGCDVAYLDELARGFLLVHAESTRRPGVTGCGLVSKGLTVNNRHAENRAPITCGRCLDQEGF